MELPEAEREWIERYLRHLETEKRYSIYTLRNYRQALEDLLKYLVENSRYADRLFERLGSRETRSYVIDAQRTGISKRTLHLRLSAIRSFFRYLRKHGVVDSNPVAGVSVPKFRKPLPKFLTEKEMARFLDGPNFLLEQGKSTPFTACRDALLFELFYGAGLRISELVQANWGNYDKSAGCLKVLGKGNKERICPVGKQASDVLKTFREDHATDPPRARTIRSRSQPPSPSPSPSPSPGLYPCHVACLGSPARWRATADDGWAPGGVPRRRTGDTPPWVSRPRARRRGIRSTSCSPPPRRRIVHTGRRRGRRDGSTTP